MKKEIKKKTIEVDAFYVDGEPKCLVLIDEKMLKCRFLGSMKFGSVPICLATMEELQYDDCFRELPCENCPIHNEPGIKEKA